MLFFLATRTQWYEMKSQVEAKWDIAAMLCLLLFFLAVTAAVYALMRPYAIRHKIVALIIAFPLGYGAAYMGVHKGLAPEFYRMACEEFMQKMGLNEASAANSCQKRNPINLSRIKRI